MSELSIASVERIIKKAGPYRISNQVTYLMADLMEQYAGKLIYEAHRQTLHAKRKTVSTTDVQMALGKEK